MKIPRDLPYLTLLFLVIFFILQFLLPVFLPFGVGFAAALAAEPAVRFLTGKAHLPRFFAVFLSVSGVLTLFFTVLAILFAFLFRELGLLTGILPELLTALRAGMLSLQDQLLAAAAKMPGDLSAFFGSVASRLFSGGSDLASRISTFLLGLAGGALAHLPEELLSLATAVLAAFLFSLKMPAIRALLQRPEAEKLRIFRRRAADSLGSYLKAQAALAGIIFLVVSLGLFLLSVPLFPLWGMVIALVDAVPVLGTGTVLLPWCAVCFLEGDSFRALGLLFVYAAALLTRTVLEPKLLGSQLGLDPLLTLAALYAGFRLWGIPGLILAPMIAATALRCRGIFQL